MGVKLQSITAGNIILQPSSLHHVDHLQLLVYQSIISGITKISTFQPVLALEDLYLYVPAWLGMHLIGAGFAPKNSTSCSMLVVQ